MAKKEYTLKIKLVCGKCFRELEFNEGSDGDVDLEIQTQLCPDCMEKIIKKTEKKAYEKATEGLNKVIENIMKKI